MTLEVAVDARWLQYEPLGGVARAVLGHLRLLRDDVDFTLLTDARLPPIRGEVRAGLPVVALRAPVSGHAVSWLQLAAPRFLRSFGGIFHCPFYGLPYRQPVPMVVTIHDITFEDHPEWFTRGRRLVFRVQARHAARTARRILTPSQVVKHDVCTRYGVPEERMVVAPNVLDPIYLSPPPPRPDVLDRHGAGTRYVLAVGGAPRRGVDELLAAWPAIADAVADVTLVVVGPVAGSLPARAVAVGALSDDEWRGALGAAEVLCYPTHHEGFGYPAVEANALGTPVVCGRVGALPEVLGDAARWVDVLSPREIAEGVVDVLEHAALHEALADAGRARVARIDEPATAASVLSAYEAAARSV